MVAFEKANSLKNPFSYCFYYCSVWQVSFNKGNVLIDLLKLRIFPLMSHTISFSFYKPKAGLYQGFYGVVFFPDMNKVILTGVMGGDMCKILLIVVTG